MADSHQLKYVWTTKPSRPMRRRKQLPEGLFTFNTSSNGSIKEAKPAIEDFNQKSKLKNGSKAKGIEPMDVVSEFWLPVSHEKSAQKESSNIVTKKHKKGPPSKNIVSKKHKKGPQSNNIVTKKHKKGLPSNNIVEHETSFLVNSFRSKISIEDNNTFKKATNTSVSISGKNIIHDKSTPLSTDRTNMIPVRRLADNFVQFSETSVNDNSEPDKKILENKASTNNISSDLSNRKRPTIVAVSPIKESPEEQNVNNAKQANISSCNTVILENRNEKKLEFHKGITPNGKEPKPIKLKTSKYKITLPKKKKPPLSVQFVSIPCIDDKKWCMNKVKKPKPQGTKEKPKLIPEGELTEVLLWSERSNSRRITDLTDLEVAYTVIERFFNEYSPRNEKMSEWIKKYEKCFGKKVAEKLHLVESYKEISQKIRKLSKENDRLIKQKFPTS